MKKLTLIATILAITVQSYGQWYPQESPTQKNLKEVFFLNENIGWISGSWYWNAALSDSVLLHTNDGGENWEEISNEYVFGKIQFIDEYTGWALNHVHTWNIYLIKTIDGGCTWDTCFFYSEWGGVIDFEFFNPNDGILLCRKDGDLYQLFTTNNGGNTWTGEALMNSMFGMDFINMQTGYFLKYSDYMGYPLGIYKTDSLGYGMHVVNGLMATDIFFLNESIGFARKLNGAGVYKTLDSANTFINISPPYQINSFNSMWLEDQNKGWIVGDEINYTWDGGLTWEKQYSGNMEIQSICFSNSLNGWAVGDDGFILHTTNGGGTVTHISKNAPNLESLKIYPNPVSETVTIEFVVEEQGTFVIDVYNAMGKKVSQPISRTYSKGLHRLKWNASNLDDGIYFCHFRIKKSSTTKRIIKMR